MLIELLGYVLMCILTDLSATIVPHAMLVLYNLYIICITAIEGK